jgi:hypothetical protein
MVCLVYRGIGAVVVIEPVEGEIPSRRVGPGAFEDV